MRHIIEKNLGASFEATVVQNLLDSYERMVRVNRVGDFPSALMHAGRFVEHTIRAIEYARTGKAPSSIKSVAVAIREIENDTSLNDSLRMLIPRVAYGMIYDIRSKRNAIHVNEINPSAIDTSLALAASGWIIAELIRLYHSSDEEEINHAMRVLTNPILPIIEIIDGESIVSERVPVNIELLLLICHSSPKGLNRSQIGKLAKCSASSVTRGLQSLESNRLIHRGRDGLFHATGPGEASLARWLQPGGE